MCCFIKGVNKVILIINYCIISDNHIDKFAKILVP